MNINKHCLILLSIVLLKNTLCFGFFGGIDFAQLVKEMEQLIEEEEASKPKPTAEGEATQEKNSQSEQKTTLSPSVFTMDKKKLFLDPIEIKEGDAKNGKKGSYTFSQHKIDAYHHYMNRFVDSMKTIEKKIDASKDFSPEFKKNFLRFKKHIDTIVVADGFITDRTMYLRAFFLPNFNDLRNKIISTLDQLELLNNRIVLDVKNEEKAADVEKLTDLAKKKETIQKPIVSRGQIPTPGSRGAE